MDIRNTDVEFIMNHLIQQGYTPEQRIQIFDLASMITKGRNNLCTEVKKE